MRRTLSCLLHPSFKRLPNYTQLESQLGASQAQRETRWMVESLMKKEKSGKSSSSATAFSAASSSSSNGNIDHLTSPSLSTLHTYLTRRLSGEPLQYILGDVTFLTLPLNVRKPILIPRPETELMTAWVMTRWKRRDWRKKYQNMSVTQETEWKDVEEWMVEKKDSQHAATSASSSLSSSSSTAASSLSPSSQSHPPLRILDLCSGSGNISLSLYHHFPYPSHVLGCDFNPDAVDLARENMMKLQEEFPKWKHGVSARSNCFLGFKQLDILEKDATEQRDQERFFAQQGMNSFLSASLSPPKFTKRLASMTTSSKHSTAASNPSSSATSSLTAASPSSQSPFSFSRINLLISNPPYIPQPEYTTLDPVVREHEDYHALISGDDGMDVLGMILKATPTLLQGGKYEIGAAAASSTADPSFHDTSHWDVPELILEIGSSSQALHLAQLLQHEYEFGHVTIHHDLAGLPRWICAGRRKKEEMK